MGLEKPGEENLLLFRAHAQKATPVGQKLLRVLYVVISLSRDTG